MNSAALGWSDTPKWRLRRRFGAWNGTLLAGIGFAVLIGVAMNVLPPLGRLHANVVAYGTQPERGAAAVA
jgi:hypothetical protein